MANLQYWHTPIQVFEDKVNGLALIYLTRGVRFFYAKTDSEVNLLHSPRKGETKAIKNRIRKREGREDKINEAGL